MTGVGAASIPTLQNIVLTRPYSSKDEEQKILAPHYMSFHIFWNCRTAVTAHLLIYAIAKELGMGCPSLELEE
jgi:hypothetical protein